MTTMQLARIALEAEHGTQEQEDAFNAVMKVLEQEVSRGNWAEFENWCIVNPRPDYKEIIWEAIEIMSTAP